MEVQQVRYDGNSKFMWDGEVYETAETAEARQQQYAGNGFEVRSFQQGGKHLLYTRRVVTEVVVEGQPPV